MNTQSSWRAHAQTRRTLTRAALSAAATTGVLALAACGAGSAPAKKERTTPATVRFMALGSGTAMQWQLQQFEKFNQTIGAAQKIVVAPEPESDQTKLFEKFQAPAPPGPPPTLAAPKKWGAFEGSTRVPWTILAAYSRPAKSSTRTTRMPACRTP